TAVHVRDESNCPKRSDRAAALGLWEQVRAGLLATVVSRESNPASVRLLEFEREMAGHDDEITKLTVRADSATGTAKSFDSAHSATDFVHNGFSTDSDGTRLLFGPDADVLLDDSFAAAYCFQLAAAVASRPKQVGLAFAAASRLRDRVDIDGTLWVDTSARALREIEYRYRGLPGNTDAFHPGGQISFHQTANGSVMIDRWLIRSLGSVREHDLINGRVVETVRLYPHEAGGELASAAWPDGTMWRASLGTLHIHAESRGKAAGGYEISLPGTHYRATTDANGDAEIRDLIPGPYTVEVADLATPPAPVRLQKPLTFVAFRDSVLRATIQLSGVVRTVP
ncbi:MAG TPA: carboxypeptidase-like regulatory domain-containing protein, partial [Gemmatimonadaceae bacterium]|nr:carboxypeptidase-like regulatory domain-containing protein [Gemmatimonadaceae bacterium]